VQYWLMKSEPCECSVDGALAAQNAVAAWVGVRNHQAHIFMRYAVQVLKKDNRLSITPVPAADWRVITQML